MNHNIVARVLRLGLVLAGTVILSAYQCGPVTGDPCADEPEQAVSFEVSGDCGPPGEVTARADARTCEGTLAGGLEVGLPELANRNLAESMSFEKSGWTAVGKRAEIGPRYTCKARAGRSGGLELPCTESGGAGECVATLRMLRLREAAIAASSRCCPSLTTPHS